MSVCTDLPFEDHGPLVRTEDPDTSHATAASLEEGTRLTDEQLRVDQLHLMAHGGLTDEELLARYQDVYGQVAESTPRKRRCDLTRKGRIVDGGERRLLVSGRHGIVWRHVRHL